MTLSATPSPSFKKPAPLWLRGARVLLALGLVTSALVAWLNVRGEADLELNTPTPSAAPKRRGKNAGAW